MKYRKQSRQKRSRPFPTEYPKSPLQNGVPRTFLIKNTGRPNCPLLAGGSQSGLGIIVHYEILKIEDEFGDIFTNFYAIRGDEITRVRNKKTHESLQDERSRYNDQIGWASCQPGWIANVWVNDGKGDDSKYKINARQCGIASVLTQLCLMDPKLNGRNQERGNSAILELGEAADLLGYTDKIKENCKQFVGLVNAADPKSGAFAYFSAAIRENYGDMMVQQRQKKRQNDGHARRPKLQDFSIYETQNAKKYYNPDTGMIGKCGCNDYVCDAHNAVWFFCKQ